MNHTAPMICQIRAIAENAGSAIENYTDDELRTVARALFYASKDVEAIRAHRRKFEEWLDRDHQQASHDVELEDLFDVSGDAP